LFEFYLVYLFLFRNIFEASFCIGAAETEIDRQIERFIFITVLPAYQYWFFRPVLWIRDILLRILIRESVPLTYGSGNRIRIQSFDQWLSRCQQKISFLNKFFASYILKLYLHYRVPWSSKIKRHKEEEVTKQQKSKFFLLFFLDGRIRIWEAQKPPDLDPQYCFRHVFFFLDAFKPAFQVRWHSLHYEYYLVSTLKSKD
jgi:hypothetical protein